MNNNIKHEIGFLKGLLRGTKSLHPLRKGWKSSYLIRIVTIYLVLDLALNLLVSIPLFTFFDRYFDTYVDLEETDLELLFYGALVMPFIEEVIFRGPMTLAKHKSRLTNQLLFWSLTVLFALIHIFNYDFESIPFWVYPFMVIPQLITGILLGVVRVRFGLRYSIILHSSFNFVLILFGIIWPE